MATSKIQWAYQSLQAFTITLASLATVSSRQSTRVTQSSPAETHVEISGKITTGTTPGSSKYAEIYLIRRDANGDADDAAGTTDAAITIANAQLIAVVPLPSGSNTAVTFGPIVVEDPGLDFVVAVKNGSAASLHATAGNHRISYALKSLQGQAA